MFKTVFVTVALWAGVALAAPSTTVSLNFVAGTAPVARANTITISNASGAAVSNYPFQFGRPFLNGAIPHAPQVLIKANRSRLRLMSKTASRRLGRIRGNRRDDPDHPGIGLAGTGGFRARLSAEDKEMKTANFHQGTADAMGVALYLCPDGSVTNSRKVGVEPTATIEPHERWRPAGDHGLGEQIRVSGALSR